MTHRFPAFALAGSFLLGAFASSVAAQDVPQSQHRLGIRVVSAEIRDTINPHWPVSGKWLVVRTVADSPTLTVGVRLGSTSAEQEIYPLYQVFELGPGSVLWQEQDTTMTAYLEWPGPQVPVQLVFDVAAVPGPYRLHIGPHLCFIVPFAAAAPQPDARRVSVRVLSATRSDSALVNSGTHTETMAGPWLVVWVEMAVVGESEVEAGAIALLSTDNSFEEPPDALAVDSAGGSAREFVSATSELTLTSPTGGKVTVLNRGWLYGGVELTMQGRQILGLLFRVGASSPPYGLVFGDSTYAVPLDVSRDSRHVSRRPR